MVSVNLTINTHHAQLLATMCFTTSAILDVISTGVIGMSEQLWRDSKIHQTREKPSL
jgi:hypothetical protein